MTSIDFTRYIRKGKRVIVPDEVMTLLDLKIGDLVHVTIQKTEVKK